MSAAMTARAAQAALRAVASPERAASSRRFFKAGPGEYGEGDVFIGVDVPTQRKIARTFAALPLDEVRALLASEVHEDRLVALFVLGHHMTRAKKDRAARAQVVEFYLAERGRVNNWDLVDSSAAPILGAHLLGERDRTILDELAGEDHLWSRRIAMIATHAFIRAGESADALRIAARLLGDREDLMHKAVGWMLREIGERDRAALDGFLEQHAATMPRTALRYALEKHDQATRARFMGARRAEGDATSGRRGSGGSPSRAR